MFFTKTIFPIYWKLEMNFQRIFKSWKSVSAKQESLMGFSDWNNAFRVG